LGAIRFCHDDHSFGTAPGTRSGHLFLVSIDVEAIGGDVAIFIEWIEVFGYRIATRIADALMPSNADFHGSTQSLANLRSL
jgi:hypothetical protein